MERAGTPVGHWHSSSETGMPTLSFGKVHFEQLHFNAGLA